MINEATFADRRRIHTPVIFWTIQAHNVTKQKKKGKKTLKLRVSLVYLGFTRGREISSLFDFNETAGAGLAKYAEESYMIT